MLLLLILWSLSLLCALLGWKLAARSRPLATSIAGCCCAMLVAGAYTAKNLQLIPEWLLLPATARLESSWFAPAAMVLFFVAVRVELAAEFSAWRWREFPRKTWLLLILSFCVLGAATISLVRRMDWGVNWYTADAIAKAKVDPDGVVRQSTSFTCGAASAATLLRRVGADANASEAQLIPLCLTQPWGGATTLGIAVGMASVARPAGLHVKIMQPGWDDFRRLRLPVLCAVEYSSSINHAVVVIAIDAQRGVLVADPLCGENWWTTAEFRKRYLNEAITVYGDAPYR